MRIRGAHGRRIADGGRVSNVVNITDFRGDRESARKIIQAMLRDGDPRVLDFMDLELLKLVLNVPKKYWDLFDEEFSKKFGKNVGGCK